ncbi:MAG: DUF456 family protein [Gemmatimonadales bacterium]
MAAQLGGLLLVPLGLPGLWLMVAAAVAHQLLADPATIGWTAILIATALATVAEILEFTLSVRYTEKYGGSKRAGWGALIGGLVGAVMGVPIPIIGSVIGRVWATMAKTTLGFAIAIIVLVRAWPTP